MQIPKVMEVKTAVTLSVAAFVAAVFIGIFGPVVAYGLAACAFVGGAYAAALQWAPELFGPKKAP